MKNRKKAERKTKRKTEKKQKTEKYRFFKKADEKGLFLSHHKNS